MDTPSLPDAPLLQGFAPVAARNARVLVLGSMPGVASLQARRYYAHPRNAFWPIMGALVGAGPDLPYADRLARLKSAGIALWDVLDRCEREGSLDSAIVDATAQANDFAAFFQRHAMLTAVLFNGAKAEAAFRRFGPPLDAFGLRAWRLPSTSPANASVPFAKKLAAWREALQAAGIATSD
ncbi:DNA-deoxyinosine glycosylase [Lysobacter auxotrophicus]|uniref:DNA-deoxyinosine glycosylase n=1 Tax=Lysobacter auxotrophicus TaxID=2992573 RepID=A0ABN6UIQ5_9GAMM|nr:DNA-deoxyinosine glycosylase [Lysobacter auxotrophicus]BDU16157.1 DNA-deoxyinosine glycosylase [Lysobacter auxotrophicus]